MTPVPSAWGGAWDTTRRTGWQSRWRRICKRPYQPRALQKKPPHGKAGGQNARERLENVRGAFTAQPALAEGLRCFWWTTMITTGATAAACAEALLRAGALEVFAVVWLETPP